MTFVYDSDIEAKKPKVTPTANIIEDAVRGLLEQASESLVEQIAKVCTDSFRKRGWRERIERIKDAGKADALIEALDYIRKSHDPRITDMEPVREPARYMAGCIKSIEAKIAGGA